MNTFLLTPFLTSLKTDDFHITVADYERIRVVLGAGGPWTIVRLRDVLVSLLARDPDRRDLFLRRFDAFFPTDREADLNEDEIALALDNIRSLVARETSDETPKDREDDAPIPIPPIPPTGVGRHAKMIAIGSVVAIALAVTGWILMSGPQEVAPRITMTPPVLSFSPGEQKPVTLKNNGLGQAVIQSVRLTGDHASAFDIGSVNTPFSLEANESREITVKFPQTGETGNRFASVEITCNDANCPLKTALSGFPKHADEPPGGTVMVTAPQITDIQFVSRPVRGLGWFLIAGFSAVLFAICLIYVLRWRKIPEPPAIDWDENGERHFSFADIGDDPKPFLNREDLDHLADSMGYFQTGVPGRRMDVRESVRVSVREGTPLIRFETRKQVRALMVLEDMFSEDRTWNAIAGELADGMENRGVPVVRGFFQGAPHTFRTADGSVFQLEDLEDDRRGYVVLVFSDGKDLRSDDHRFAIESLSGWPMKAWMDMTDPAIREHPLLLPDDFPIFPATPDGIREAISRNLNERGDTDREKNVSEAVADIPGNPDARVEYVLGDALMWAQDCAMFQPMSVRLAHTVREKFHRDLPRERIARLFALPDTDPEASGIRFSDDVCAVLRRGFLERRTDTEQEAVLRFLLEQVEKAEPFPSRSLGTSGLPETSGLPGTSGLPETSDIEKPSLCHLKWEIAKEKIRAELTKGKRMSRLVALSGTPAGVSLAADFESNKTGKIPLRLDTNDPGIRQQLARLRGNPFEIGKTDALPLRSRHMATLVALGGICLVSLLAGSMERLSWKETGTAIEISGKGAEFAVLQADDGQPSGLGIGQKNIMNLKSGRNYKITVFGESEYAEKTFAFEKVQDVRVRVKEEQIVKPCVEEYSDIGLKVMRCADKSVAFEKSKLEKWSNHAKKLLSGGRALAGIEFAGTGANGNETKLGNALLASGMVDRIYRLENGNTNMPEQKGTHRAFKQIGRDLLPWADFRAVIWWTTGGYPIDSLTGELGNYRSLVSIDSEKEAWLAALGDASPVPPPITTDIGMTFVYIKPGTFMMGSPEKEPERYNNEILHEVTISKGFYIQTTEVTQGQWKTIMGDNPSNFKDCGDECPVETVSWNDAIEFIRKLNKKEGRDIYRLPTEAEWEYACRAGTDTAFSFGNCLSTSQANYDGNYPLTDCAKGEYREKTFRVGSLEGNSWGLYDMHGNVWEWCSDWYDEYPKEGGGDPTGPATGAYRVLRGGSWDGTARGCRSAYRVWFGPGYRSLYAGFRLSRSLD